MLNKYIAAILLLPFFLAIMVPLARSQEANEATPGFHAHEEKRAAIFIKNRVGATFSDKLGAFEDLIIGEIADLGFRVVSPQDSRKSLQTFANEERLTDLDKLLESRTSAIRLAQNMGVDYLIVVSVTTFGTDEQHLHRPDLKINRTVVDHSLRATYKIVDAVTGDSRSAGTVIAAKRVQQSPEARIKADVVNSLLSDAAQQIAGKLDQKGAVTLLADLSTANNKATFFVVCSMQDLSVPEVVKDENGDLVLAGNRYKLEPIAVTVELNGDVIGTAPGEFTAAPGQHTLRLTREGFKDWERSINVIDGLQLNVALTLTDEGRAYWLQMAEFFAKLKREERISEADAELIRGVAQKMRQSGIRLDKKVDVNIDTDQSPTIQQTNVDQQNVAASVWP
ncbi:MAG TPA: PEGA domain-containing protein [Kiritimatiellia bacterium]|nr:PEGA domain-containing protein [Kiritimatiellia bacterium]